MWYLLLHGFYTVRSYASHGVIDLLSIPPKIANNTQALASQCKNTKKGSYMSPRERDNLKRFAETHQCLVVEPFKEDRTCNVKLDPWNLNSKSMKPDEFLYQFYGLEAITWKDFHGQLRKIREKKTNN